MPLPKVSPFASVALALLRLGYRPIPVMPGDKAPGMVERGAWTPMVGWTRYRDEEPKDFILKLWCKWPDAGIGIVLGVKVGEWELIALDFDTDDTYLLEMIESAVPRSNVTKRGRRGYTGFYLAPAGTTGRRFQRGKQTIFEILTGNSPRQTIVPPSLHRDTGEPYVWTSKRTLADTPPLKLVHLTQDDIDRLVDTLESLEGVSEAKAPARLPPGDGDTPHRILNNMALIKLGDWVPALSLYNLKRTGSGYQAVAHWRSSSTGRPLDARARNLSIHPGGIKDFGTGEGYTALNLVCRTANWPLDHAFAWLAGRLGMLEEAWEEPELQPQPSAVHELPPHDPETGEILASADNELPDHLTRPPGLLGEVVDWIEASARRPSRVLALGAAVTVLGTLVGRRLAGPTLSGTHLYVITLAQSGGGKDHPLRVIELLLNAANAGHLAGPDDFMSMTAIIGVLKRSPVCLCAMDEFGAYLARVGHRRASPHEKGMTKVLRSAWGASFQSIRTPEWGGKQSEPIYSPSMSIYGSSTPEELFGALKGEDIVNGFLNRFLLLQTEQKVPDRKPLADPLYVPAALGSKLARVYMEAQAVRAEEMAHPFGNPRPVQMEWADAAAEVYFNQFRQQVEDIREDVELRELFARTVEMAVRLATIRAVGLKNPVALNDIAWGAEIALWSARRMAEAAGEHIAENEFAGYANRIVRFIRKKGFAVSRREIQMHLKGALKVKELSDVLEVLVESGRVSASKPPRPEMGRLPVVPLYSIMVGNGSV